jgi:hypothetical protein
MPTNKQLFSAEKKEDAQVCAHACCLPMRCRLPLSSSCACPSCTTTLMQPGPLLQPGVRSC